MADGPLRDEPDGFWTRTTSPDGAHVWVVNAWDVKMSHWIFGGALWRRTPATKLFEAPSGWSFEGRTWLSAAMLRLDGRRYPGRLPGITLTIDVGAGQATIVVDDLEAAQAQGSCVGVEASEVPEPPAGPRALAEALAWLDAFPGRAT